MTKLTQRSIETLVALAVIAGLFALLWVKVISVEEVPRPAPPMELGPVPVSTEVLVRGDLPRDLRVQGSLTPYRRTTLAVETGGRLVEVFEGWRAGRRVAAGELLARVDGTPAELAWETARAQVDQAQAALEAAEVEVEQAAAGLAILERSLALAVRERQRLTELRATGEVSTAQVDQALGLELGAESAVQQARSGLARGQAAVGSARATVAAAEAARDQAEDRRRRHSVTAPFDGVLTSTGPEPGLVVAPGTPLGELMDLEQLLLVAQVHESRLAGLAPGQSVEVTLPSRPGLGLAGTVVRLGVQADPMSRNLPVEVRVDNREAGLAAGLFAEGQVQLEPLADALWLSRSSFRWVAGEPVAFVVEDAGGSRDPGQQAVPRVLRLGLAVGEGFVVEVGLAAGERVVRSPLDRMDPTGPVAVQTGAGTER